MSTPVERFLGETFAMGGPFALLGVHPEQCTEATVLAALDVQLSRVGAHAEAETPAADEVRLALHSAAAQLLDPATRAQLVTRWRGTKVPASAPSAGPRGVPATARISSTPAQTGPSAARQPLAVPERASLERDALLSIGMMGGWNRQALERFAMLARARGYGQQHVASVVRTLARGGHSAVQPALTSTALRDSHRGDQTRQSRRTAHRAGGRGAATDRHRPDDWSTADPSLRLLRRLILAGSAAILAIAVSLGLLAVWLSHETPATPVRSAASVGGAATSARPGPSNDRVPEATSNEASPASPDAVSSPVTASLDLLAADLQRATELVGSSPSKGLELFCSRVRAFGTGWATLPRDRVIAGNDAVLGFIYRVVDSPGVLMPALECIAGQTNPLGPARQRGSASAIAPGVWGVGLLTRLSGERELPASARTLIFQRLAGALGQARPSIETTFDAGVNAAMLVLPVWMTPPRPVDATQMPLEPHDQSSWSAWTELATSPAITDDQGRTRLVIAGLEHLLVAGADGGSDAGVRASVAAMVTRIPWRDGDESRRWLLRAFDDQRFTPGDLQAVTTSLATSSAAPGVDTTMVLSAGADERARLEMRDRYAQAWNVQDAVDRGQIVADLRVLAEAALARGDKAGDPAIQLAAAVAMSRASESIGWLWRGEREEAAMGAKGSSADLDDLLTAAARTSDGPLLGEVSGDAEWAMRFKTSPANPRLRLEQLDTLARSGRTIGPVDAEVLVLEAVTGQAQDVRQRAGDIVLQFANEPAIVNAMLEVLPRLSRGAANARLVEYVSQGRLPSTRDPRWTIEARRALVERLLEVAAAGSESRVVDQFAAKLQQSYRVRALTKPPDPEDRRTMSVAPAHVSAYAQAQPWRRQADALIPRLYAGLTLQQIDQRRAARLGIAQGLVEAFAVEQTHLCELMAYVVAGEEASRAPAVLSLMDELGRARRSATSVVEQIRHVEAAMLRVWLIRIQESET